MLSTVLTGLWSRKRRLFGTVTAVVLGVAFLAATLVIADTQRADFSQAFTTANAGTDVIVRNADEVDGETAVRGLIDAGLVDEVAAIDGVAEAVPSIEGVATVLGSDGERIGGDGPPTTAANWVDEPALNPYQLAEGRAPAVDDEGASGGAKPYEVVIDRATAEKGNLSVGDHTTVLTPEPVEVTIVGIATFGDADSLGPITYTAFTLPAAQELLAGRPDAISSVLVAAEDGVSQETLRDEIMRLMPARIEALTQAELIAEQEEEIESDFLGVFNMMLLAFAGVAMVVAAFSIHNTFSILVAQRTRESALLRALGASRRQVVVGVALEALAIGTVATAIGFGAGIGLATGLKQLFASADLALSSSGLVIDGGTIATTAIVGILTTLVASLVPALKASRVAPLAALRDVAIDRSAVSKTRVTVGFLLAGAGVASVIAGASSGDGAVSRVGLGAIAVLVGAVVLGPVAARPAAAVLGSGAAVAGGFTGRIARRNAMRNPRRIAASASALMVGTGVVALFTTFGSSLKATIDDAVDNRFGGDMIVEQDGFSGAPLSPELPGAIAERPEVDDAVGVAFAAASIDGDDVEPAATDFVRLDAMLDMGVADGSVSDLSSGRIAISEHYAEEHRLATGDTIPMTFVDGATTELEVGVIFTERMSFGDLVMATSDWAPHARQNGDAVVFVDLADGVSEADGLAAVGTVTERYSAPDPQTREEYKDSVGSEIDSMLAVIYGLLAVAVVIAVMGIGNTLALSIHERTRELGLLRAVGQSRRQLRATVRWESVIMAVFGTLGGLAVGTFLGWGLMRAINAQEGFGVFEAPVSSLAVVLVLAAVAGIVAAMRPARRAARLDILDAIATD
jgi:putative ABC transport system permease protein